MTVPTAPDLRLTPQRRAVLDALTASHDHPTASEVYERVKASTPGIGAATVYRTLALLVSTGLALELKIGEGAASRYDARVDRHDHLVCESCGRALDVEAPVPTALLQSVAATTGFAVTSYDLQFRGLCPDCVTNLPDLS
ncbi:MAG TPA: transcriptional repressor [Mycobacteriales bacterium]|nr:transcriptional repressor [Mycobacteriales bacterium]